MAQPHNNTEDTIDLSELVFSFLSQWKIIVACTILGLVSALLYLRVTPSSYAVDGTVQVEDNKNTTKMLLGDLSNILDDKSQGQTEIEIIQSRLVLGNAIQNLHLDITLHNSKDGLTNRLFSQHPYKTLYSEQGVVFQTTHPLFQITRFDVPTDFLNQKFQLNVLNNQNFELTLPDERIVKGVFGQPLVSDLNGQPMILTINALASNLFPEQYALQKFSMDSAVKHLMTNLTVTEKGKQTGILSLSYQGQDRYLTARVLNEILTVYLNQNVAQRSAETKQTLAFLDQQLPQLKKELEAAEQQFNQFREKNGTVDVDKESELMLTQATTLDTNRIELKQKQAELAARYTDNHPMIAAINAQLQAIDSKNAELEQHLKSLPETQRQFLQLSREVEVKTQLYTALLNNYQQLKITKAGEIGNVRIVDTAIVPVEPIKPKKMIVLVLSLFIGGFVGILVGLLRMKIQTGVKDAHTIENDLDLPVYATIPRSERQYALSRKKQYELLAVTDSEDIAIESLRSIRAVLHFALKTAKNNIITISSSSPDIGKSFVSSNLAAVLAQNGQTVLLVDGDLRRGFLHKYMQVMKAPGLSEYLSKPMNLDDIIHHTKVRGLDFIARGLSPDHPAETLSSTNFDAFLELVSKRYDHVIIDTPPILAVADATVISHHAGVVLLVARYAKTHINELKLCVSRLKQADIAVNGILLNDIHSGAGGSYSYRYGYGYNYAYSYRKTNDKHD